MHLTFSPMKKVGKTNQFLLFLKIKPILLLLLTCLCLQFGQAQVVINEVFADGTFELKIIQIPQ